MVRVLPAQTRWIASDFCCSSFCGGLWAAFEAVDEMGGNLPASSAGNTGNILLLSLFWGGKEKKKKNLPRWISLMCVFVHTQSVCIDVWTCHGKVRKTIHVKERKQHLVVSPETPEWRMSLPLTFTHYFSCTKTHTKRGCYCNILLFESTVCLFHKMNTNEHHNTNYD